MSERPDARAPNRSARPVDAVITRLRDAILRGTHAPGDMLPPERELAVTLGVSRLTLRAALARLEAEGLVRARQGDGVHVLDPRRHATLALLSHLSLARQPELVRAFLELRRAIACEAVALASERMADTAIDALAGLVEAQRSERSAAGYAARDLEISRAVLVGADNHAMLLLLNTLESVLHAQPAVLAALHADRGASLAGYDALLALLRAREPARARALLRSALEQLDAAALTRLEGRRKPQTAAEETPARAPRRAKAPRAAAKSVTRAATKGARR
jgi:GntR family transcriptional repressor for pyruvate dehydrogenase complex